MKKYLEFINEDVKDILKPKSDKDIKKSLGLNNDIYEFVMNYTKNMKFQNDKIFFFTFCSKLKTYSDYMMYLIDEAFKSASEKGEVTTKVLWASYTYNQKSKYIDDIEDIIYYFCENNNIYEITTFSNDVFINFIEGLKKTSWYDKDKFEEYKKLINTKSSIIKKLINIENKIIDIDYSNKQELERIGNKLKEILK